MSSNPKYYINARIVTVENGVIENGYIEVKKGKIAAIGDMNEFSGKGKAFDVGGMSIYPGFIDAHSHLGMWEDGLGFEGDDGNETTDPSTPHLRAIDAVNSFDRCFEEALAAGVTSVVTGPGSANPIGGQLTCIKTRIGVVDEHIVKECVAMKMAFGENPKQNYHDRDESPYTRMATAAIIREQLIKAERYKKAVDAADEEDDKPEYDIKLEALLPVLSGELPVHFHAHRRDDIFTAIRIAKEFNLNYCIVHCTEGYMEAERLAKEGVKIFAGPILCDRSKPELKNLTPKAPAVLEQAGVEPAIITDHPVIPIQYLPLCAALAVREGMSRDSALRSITITPAKLLGVEDRIGSIAVGKDADFSIFDADPISLAAKPKLVVVDGEICYRG